MPYARTTLQTATIEAAGGLLDPFSNRLLAALGEAGCNNLLHLGEPVYLRAATVLYEPGDTRQFAYFPTSCILGFAALLEDGSETEYAMSGCEGMAGISIVMGADRTMTRTMVIQPGYAYRLGSRALKTEFERDGEVRHVLLRYAQALIAQITQTVACNRYHSVEQQFCRWLLLCLDRLPSSELTMTQEQIATMLSVRRESITAVASKLRAIGAIHYHRGRMVALDRSKIELLACECYGVVNREYARLFPAIPKGECCPVRVPRNAGWGSHPPPLHPS